MWRRQATDLGPHQPQLGDYGLSMTAGLKLPPPEDIRAKGLSSVVQVSSPTTSGRGLQEQVKDRVTASRRRTSLRHSAFGYKAIDAAPWARGSKYRGPARASRLAASSLKWPK